MHIARDTVVTIEYTAALEDGTVIDTTDHCGPITYLHGHEQIFAPLERAIEGLEAGANREIQLSAAESYGERRQELVRRIPLAQLPRDLGLVPGERYTLRTPGGQPLVFRLVAIEGDEVVADFNSGGAGLALHIAAKVLAVRAATAEELQRGGAR
jgi:FKBP-type peptidyl-prolyl cis-trans isomerase SlyD